MSGISTWPRKVASVALGAPTSPSAVTFDMYASETTSPLSAHKMQGFVAGHSVAYAFISEEQRAGPAIDGTSEEGSAMKRYGTVAMNYIQLSAHERSDEGASSRSSNVERDNQVFTDLARRTSVIEAGKKLSACRLRVVLRQLQRSATLMTRRQLRAHKNLCADVIGNDFDLTKNKFSYTPLKEVETKVPEIFEVCASPG